MSHHLSHERLFSGILFSPPADPLTIMQHEQPKQRRKRSYAYKVPWGGGARPLVKGCSLGSRQENPKNIQDDTLFTQLENEPYGNASPLSETPSQTQYFLPILEVNIDTTVEGSLASTKLTQSFYNNTGLAIPEAQYSFPLYDGAAVTSFECAIGDSLRIHGVVKSRAQAKDDYDRARTERQEAVALLEEQTPEIFETTLGNIPPDTKVTIMLTYVNELKIAILSEESSEGLILTIPTSLAPRYGGRTSSNPYSSYDRITEGKSIDIWVKVIDTGNIDNFHVESTHVMKYKGTEPVQHKGTVSSLGELSDWGSDETQTQSIHHYSSTQSPFLSSDLIFVIQMCPGSHFQSQAVLAPASPRNDGIAAMMVTLRPSELFRESLRPRAFSGELLFLLDCSTSMEGDKIKNVRDAMHLALAGMPDTCKFNILCFGFEVRGMWAESRSVNNEASMDHAREYVSRIGATMGGTEIGSALEQAVAHRALNSSSTQVILITDGEVAGRLVDQAFQVVWKSRQDLKEKIRFFTLGIGDQASHRFLEVIAETGGGYCEVVDVEKKPRWEDRLNRMLRSALEPESWACDIVLGPEFQRRELVSLEFGASGTSTGQALIPYAQSPHPLPPLHPFRFTSVFFLINLQGRQNPMNVKVSTTSGSRAREHMLDVTLSRNRAGALHHLAVKSALLDLENDMNLKKVNSAEAKGNGELLGQRYSVASRWTSFIAVTGENSDAEAKPDMKIYRSIAKSMDNISLSMGFLEEDESRLQLDLSDSGSGIFHSHMPVGMPPPPAEFSSPPPPRGMPYRGVMPAPPLRAMPYTGVIPPPPPPPAPPSPPGRCYAEVIPGVMPPPASMAVVPREVPAIPDMVVKPVSSSERLSERVTSQFSGFSYHAPIAAPDPDSATEASDSSDSVNSVTFRDLEQSTQQNDFSLDTEIGWRNIERCQVRRSGCFILTDALKQSLYEHFCPEAFNYLRHKIARQFTNIEDESINVLIDTLLIMSYLSSHLSQEKDNWCLLMEKAKYGILMAMGLPEDEEEKLVPFEEDLASSIAHVHFNEAVREATVTTAESKETQRKLEPLTCKICSGEVGMPSWMTNGEKEFVCLADECYDTSPSSDRNRWGDWEQFWDHQVRSGHLLCPSKKS